MRGRHFTRLAYPKGTRIGPPKKKPAHMSGFLYLDVNLNDQHVLHNEHYNLQQEQYPSQL